MSTKREQILVAVKALMTSVTGITDAHIFRSRAQAFMANAIPAMSITFLTDDPDASSTPFPIVDWRLLVRIDLFVTGPVPDQVADPIVQSVHQKLMTNLSLGGLSMDIQPAQVKLELFDGNQPVGNEVMHYMIRYRTTTTDLSA